MDQWSKQKDRNHKRGGRKKKSYQPKPPPEQIWVPVTVPRWERNFYRIIGGITWNKILKAEKDADDFPEIYAWDASASEEAFNDGKARFYARINNLPCDIPAPTPYMYIDEIDEDTARVDPELFLDLDRDLERMRSGYYLDKLIADKSHLWNQPIEPTGWDVDVTYTNTVPSVVGGH